MKQIVACHCGDYPAGECPTQNCWREVYRCAGCGMVENEHGTTDCDCPTRVMFAFRKPSRWKASNSEIELISLFKRLPLHGDAGCDKLTDEEWRIVALAAIGALSRIQAGDRV